MRRGIQNPAIGIGPSRGSTPKPLSDAGVEASLFQHLGRSEPSQRATIDLPWVHAELGGVA
jgi:hypothetical protein